MSKPDLEAQLDQAIDAILADDWGMPASAAPTAPTTRPAPLPRQAAPQPAQAPRTYLPLPVPTDEFGEPLQARSAPDDALDDPMNEEAVERVLDIGLLTDLATGRKSAIEAARAAGVTPERMQSQLAVALREIPPEEIAKALGIQAAEQQLKSGALYGAVLSALVNDMLSGRMKPSDKLELAKLLARVGRVEPKDEKGVGAGGGFVLNIQLGNNDPKPITIEAQ